MTRVADNPHKPGTVEHAHWEQDHIHGPRAAGGLDHPHMKAIADGRLARLKADIAARRTWVDDVLDEVADATRPEPRMAEPHGILAQNTWFLQYGTHDCFIMNHPCPCWPRDTTRPNFVIYQPSAFVSLTSLPT